MRRALATLAVIVGLVFVAAPQVMAADLLKDTCGGTGNVGAVCDPVQKNSNAQTVAKNVVNTLLYALGVVSVIMIIIGGFRYVTSSGDKAALVSAKNTIFYAVIGLVVAVLAFAIVQFVLSKVS